MSIGKSSICLFLRIHTPFFLRHGLVFSTHFSTFSLFYTIRNSLYKLPFGFLVPVVNYAISGNILFVILFLLFIIISVLDDNIL